MESTNIQKQYEDGYDSKYGYNKNAFTHHTPATYALSKIGQIITTPIGLAAEAVAHRKQKRQQGEGPTAAQGSLTSTNSQLSHDAVHGNKSQAVSHTLRDRASAEYDDENYHDSVDWALDEAAEDMASEQSVSNTGIETTPPTLLQTSITPVSKSRLPYPVVLPQRRPRTKTRGFIRAYAPILGSVGIDQSTFTGFAESLHTASQSSQWLNVVQITAGIAGVYPDLIVAGVAQAIQITAGVAMEMQERWKTNRFLDRANTTLFMPKGLYCMIVQYRKAVDGDTFVSTETIDTTAVEGIAKYGTHLMDAEAADAEKSNSSVPINPKDSSDDFENLKDKIQNRLHLASAESKGISELPIECAPLIFPVLEARAIQEDSSPLSSIKSHSARSNAFIADYFDRRARMLEASIDPDNPLNKLAGGRPEFASKMGDPHDARNTHLITLLTGGLIKAEPLGAKRRWEKAQKKEEARLAEAQSERAKDLAEGKTVGPILVEKRFLQEHILYLMIVNMPSEAELASAKAKLASRKK